MDLCEYQGPMVDGRPIHKGSCNDGVYGCSKCNTAIRFMEPEARAAAGLEETTFCEACKKNRPVDEVMERPISDEPGSTWMICDSCHWGGE